jgi:hypothetical protein
MTFKINGFNFNQSAVKGQGRVINTWADIIKRANLIVEVMHEHNNYNFLLDIAALECRICSAEARVAPKSTFAVSHTAFAVRVFAVYARDASTEARECGVGTTGEKEPELREGGATPPAQRNSAHVLIHPSLLPTLVPTLAKAVTFVRSGGWSNGVDTAAVSI